MPEYILVVTGQASEPSAQPPSLFNVAIVAGILQGACLLLAAVPGLLVSDAFCGGSLLCSTRGLRWFLWIGLCLALLFSGPFVLLASTLSTRTAWAARWLVKVEICVMILAISAAVLAAGSVVGTIDLLLALVVLLAVVVLAGMYASRRSRLWIAVRRNGRSR